MSSRSTLRRTLAGSRSARLLVVVALGLAFAPARPFRYHRLNHTLDREGIGPSLQDFELSADCSFLAYLDGDDLVAGGTAPGSSPAVLVGPANGDGEVHSFRITPDSADILFVEEHPGTAVRSLFRMPADGSQMPDLLSSAPPGTTGVLDFELSPDGATVAFRADELTSGTFELFSVPVDGSTAPVRISGPLAIGGNILEYGFNSSGTRVLYVADELTPNLDELFSAVADGSGPSVRLNGTLNGGDGIDRYAISPDGSMVAYVALQNVRREVFGVPVDGSQAAVVLNPTLPQGGAVREIAIGPDNFTVAYRADQDANNLIELFVAPIDASQAAVQVNPPLAQGGDVANQFAFTPDGLGVVYVADQDVNGTRELYVAPTDGSQTSIKLSGPVNHPDGGVVGGTVEQIFQLTPDGSSVVYVADPDVDEERGLFLSALDGSQSALALAPPTAGKTIGNAWQITGDGSHVLHWQSALSGGQTSFRSVRADGSAPPVTLNAGFSTIFSSSSFDVCASDDYVAFVSVDEYDGQEILGSPVDGSLPPRRLSAPETYQIEESLGSWVLAEDQRYVAYESDDFLITIPDREQLYTVALDGESEPVFMDSGVTLRISANSEWVVFRDPGGFDEPKLFSRETSGQTATNRLDNGVQQNIYNFEIALASDRVVYVAEPATDRRRLFSVELDGFPPSVNLVSPFVLGGEVRWFGLDPQETTAVFTGDRETIGTVELYAVPVDGSEDPVKLSGTMQPGGNVDDPAVVTPDGSRAIWRADADTDEVVELYSAPLDASQLPVKLSGTMTTGGNVDDEDPLVTPDSQCVVYLADQDIDGVRELFVVPVDGSAAPRRVHTPLSAGDDIWSFVLSPDGSRIVYRAFVGGLSSLFSTPVDGSAAPAQLDNDTAHENIGSVGVSADSNWVAYISDQDVDRVFELHSAPIDGTAPPVRVSAPMPADGDVSSFRFAIEAGLLLYLADAEVDQFSELYAAPIRGGSAFKINRPLPPGGRVYSGYEWIGSRRQIVYRASELDAQAAELFLCELPKPVSGTPADGGQGQPAGAPVRR